ncbi:hypothetical protein BO94DRAFT_299889 [Aspergillus sclerotioniger CBS 115572]|uniref:Uncharacterized protein n=1 Tax=Aspergillus sclerotioniger CBS 115572 TaxID=1450535 RepID=A0A317V848_9EURO|nr:hypothetical protein BO94DRAFT_299889 [Aspergillus sclerotioniger CBS 115572]PWY69002.1 hypothetical protein BO94DRAFT_299889 [Aspergillus sclerotioniger CBS 115572]
MVDHPNRPISPPFRKAHDRISIMTCPLCVSIEVTPTCSTMDLEQSETYRKQIFHRPCSNCDANNGLSDSLCDICQHMRLGHLCSCIFWEKLGAIHTFYEYCFLFEFGRLDDIHRPSSHCAICRGLLQGMAMNIADFSTPGVKAVLRFERKDNIFQGNRFAVDLELYCKSYHTCVNWKKPQ